MGSLHITAKTQCSQKKKTVHIWSVPAHDSREGSVWTELLPGLGVCSSLSWAWSPPHLHQVTVMPAQSQDSGLPSLILRKHSQAWLWPQLQNSLISFGALFTMILKLLIVWGILFIYFFWHLFPSTGLPAPSATSLGCFALHYGLKLGHSLSRH